MKISTFNHAVLQSIPQSLLRNRLRIILASAILVISLFSQRAKAQCDVTGSAVTTVACTGSFNGTATITLSGTGSGAPGTYTLDGGAATAFSANPFTITGLSSGSHTVVATVTGSGCVSSSIIFNVAVSTLPFPVVTASATPAVICAGASSTLTASGGNTYTWMPGSLSGGSVVVSPAGTTTYTVSGTNADGCARSNSWLKVSAGAYHTIAIKTDGTLWGWGQNDYGQVGDGTLINRNNPIQIGTANDWVAVSAGNFHNLALKSNGTLWAWGINTGGQIGDGTVINKSTPVQVGVATDWTGISAGGGHSLARKSTGTLWAWGLNVYGQIGDGTNTQRNSPVQVGVLTTWADFSAGSDHSIATRNDGTLWGWGRNTFGQVGDGTTTARNAPVQIGIETNWAKVSASYYHNLAIKTTGSLWGWGNNQYGQVGDGTQIQRNAPVQAGVATDWLEIEGGLYHSLGRKSTGTLWAWGINNYGQLGDGTTTTRVNPVQSGTATDWALISGGIYHTEAIRSAGTLWAMGYNQSGQLGDGTNTNKLLAVQINTTPVSVTVTVNPLPVVSFSGLSASYCQVAPSATLTGSPAGGTFSGPGITGNVFNPVAAGVGTHTVSYTYTNGNGCSNTASQQVTVTSTNLLDYVNLQFPGTASFCQGGSLTAYGQVYEAGVTEAPGAGAGITVEFGYHTENTNPNTWINWQPATFNVQAGNNDEYASTVTLPAGTYYYTFRYSYVLNNCGYQYGGFSAGGGNPWDGTNYISGVLVVHPYPTVTVSSSSPSVCIGSSVTLTASGASTYTWMPGSLTGTSISVSPTSTTTYTVTGTSSAGCTSAVAWSSITAGGYHNMGIRTNGTLWGSGQNTYGQIGDGTTSDRFNAVQIGTGTNWAMVSSGSFYSLAIKTDGTLWAWGSNLSGSLGDGTVIDKTSPIQIGTATNWKTVSAGGGHNLAIKTDGTLWAWGSGSYGQIGNGGFSQVNSPQQIGTATDWAFVSAGAYHSLAIKANGTLWGWGRGTSGQLGDGSATEKYSPIQIGSATNWKKVEACYFHSLGVKTDGTLWGWGRNMEGQVGDGTLIQKNVPTQSGIATNWVNVTGGLNHSIGIRSNGTVWGWGFNSYGQLGNGAQVMTNPNPIQAGTATDWMQMDAGSYHTMGVKTGASLWAFGRNMEGQLGDGTSLTFQLTPKQIGPSTAGITITVNPLPSVGFSGLASTYCLNSSPASLTGSPAGGTFSGPGISGNTFDPAAAGEGGPYIITYTYTDANGCTNSTTQSVLVNTLPGGSGSFNGLASTYCISDAPVNLTGNPLTGTFSGPGITDNGNGTASFSPAAAGTGTHVITYTFSNGTCSNTATASVTILANYTITSSAGTGGTITPVGITTVCSGNSQAYTITADPGYQISDVLVDGISAGAVSVYNFTNVISPHTIVASFVIDCFAPELTANITHVTCNGANNGSIDLVTIGGSSPFTYAWTGPGAFSAATEDISGLAPGTYSIVVTATGGCTSGTSFVVNQPDPLVVSCSGTNVTCNGANDGTVAVSVGGGTGPYTYSWTNGSGTSGSVTINPSKDNNIYGSNTSNSNALGEYIAVGNSNTGSLHRGLIAFDISANVPAGAIINSASLSFNVSASAPGAGIQPLYLHKATSNWGEGTSFTFTSGIGTAATSNDATWLHAFYPSDNWSAPGGDYQVSASAVTNVNTPGNYNFSSPGMISDIQQWLNAPAANYGWLIKGNESANSQSKRIDSRENSLSGNRPSLQVNYTIPAVIGTTATLSNLAPGTYTVTVTDQNGCTSTCSYTVTEPGPLNVSFTGLAASYCSTDAAVTLTGTPAGGSFSGPGISGNDFDPAIAGPGTHTITYTYSDGTCSNSATQQVTVTSCVTFTTLNLTAFLEGFYYDINTMRANIFDLGISSDPTETDTVTVNLWAQANLSNPNPDFSVPAVIHTNGNATMQFPLSVTGNAYYIAVKHRNHLETWSKLPVLFSSTTNYDFSSSLLQAYDDGVNAPMASVAGGKFAFYGGDVNQDGGIDATDQGEVDNDVALFAFGYNATDVSGDGSTDATDMQVVDNNLTLFLFYARPY